MAIAPSTNIQTRSFIKASDLKDLKSQIDKLLMEGEEAAMLIDALYDSLADSSWIRFCSTDLPLVADTMRSECELFNEREIEIHEAEMKGEEA